MRVRVATIRGWLLFLSQSSRCGYYSRAATVRGVASIQINTVTDISQQHSDTSLQVYSHSKFPYKTIWSKLAWHCLLGLYRMVGNFCGVQIFVIFVVDLAITKNSIHENQCLYSNTYTLTWKLLGGQGQLLSVIASNNCYSATKEEYVLHVVTSLHVRCTNLHEN